MQLPPTTITKKIKIISKINNTKIIILGVIQNENSNNQYLLAYIDDTEHSNENI
jgi:hypothetical protein